MINHLLISSFKKFTIKLWVINHKKEIISKTTRNNNKRSKCKTKSKWPNNINNGINDAHASG